MNVTVDKIWNGQDVKIRGKRVIGKSIYETGLIIEAQAKSLCPVDQGRLSASITTQAVDRGTLPKGQGAVVSDVIDRPTDPNEVLVGTPVEYGPYIEWGTVNSDAQPFLRPALDLAQGKVLTVVQNNGRFEFAEYLGG